MEIVFFTNRMTSGGSERVISYLANELSKANDVTILTMTSAKSSYYLTDGVKHIPLEDRPAKNNHGIITNVKRIIRLKKYIKEHPEAYYISFVTEPSYILMALRRYLGNKGKAIVTVRNDPKQQHKHFYDKILVRILYPKADAMVFQTVEGERYYSNIKIKKAVILPNPVNEQFIKEPYDGIRKREIINVGRLVKQKNQKMLIEAFEEVHREYPDYKLLIYGDGPLKNVLNETIKNLNLQESVFLKGNIPDLQNVIYDAEMFVLSSDYEGMPNALLEAMALGIPVISTRASGGGPETIIQNEKNGILVDIDNKEQMAHAIISLIGEKNKLRELSHNAAKISEKYSPKATLNAWDKFLKTI